MPLDAEALDAEAFGAGAFGAGTFEAGALDAKALNPVATASDAADRVSPADRRRRRGLVAESWGRAAEASVASAYAARGGVILARRRRTAAGEIDLVVRDGGVIAFVEVKARRRRRDALEAMSPARWRRLAAASELYLGEEGLGAVDARIDLATVDGDGRVAVMENVSLDF